MSNESTESGGSDGGDTSGFARPTRRTYMTLVGGTLAISGGSATAAGSSAVEGGVLNDTSSTDPGGYGFGGYGAGPYGGDGDEGPSLSDYTDEDGNAEASDVFDAIGDWRDDTIDATLVFEVIDAWRSS